jgi:hypothetical protein
MAKQVIYWNYTLWIFIYSMVFLTIGVTCGELLEIIMPKYNENKNKAIIFIEINLQIGLIAILTYFFREIVHYIFNSNFNIAKNPDTFAVIIVAPTMFSQQISLIKKIHYLWSF